MADVNWLGLAKQLAPEVTSALKPILQDAAQEATPELRLYGVGIAQDMALALKTGDEAWSTELKAQARALAELLRIQTEPQQQAAIDRTLEIVFRVARIALKVATGV